MSTRSGQQRIRVMPSEPRPRTPVALMAIAPLAGEWDDDDDLVDFQDGGQDDTVNVAAEAEQGAGMQETRGMAGGEGRGDAPVATATMAPGARSDAEPAADLAVMIRVAASGAVVTNKGGSEEQAGLVAYAHRLIDLVGDLLGLERFLATECVFKAGPGGGGQSPERCLLFTESNGDAVLLRPRTNADLQALRESLGL